MKTNKEIKNRLNALKKYYSDCKADAQREALSTPNRSADWWAYKQVTEGKISALEWVLRTNEQDDALFRKQMKANFPKPSLNQLGISFYSEVDVYTKTKILFQIVKFFNIQYPDTNIYQSTLANKIREIDFSDETQKFYKPLLKILNTDKNFKNRGQFYDTNN